MLFRSLAAAFAAAATTALYASGLGLAVLLAARLAWGACWSLLRLGGYLACLEVATGRTRGFLLGFFNGVTRLGSAIAALAGGALVDLAGFGPTVIAFAVTSTVAGVVMLGQRPPTAPVSEPAPGAAAESAAPRAADRSAGRRTLWTMYVMVFLQGLAWSGLLTSTLGLWLTQRFGPQPGLGTLVVGAATLTGALLGARFLSDFLWGPEIGRAHV